MKKSKTVRFPVIWNEMQFTEIEIFDCITIRLKCENGSTYSMRLPISSREFRKNNPTKALVKIIEYSEWTLFKIFDDYGYHSTMNIHNSLKDKINIARQSAINNNLMLG